MPFQPLISRIRHVVLTDRGKLKSVFFGVSSILIIFLPGFVKFGQMSQKWSFNQSKLLE
jgi:hypothetical protein